MADIRVDIELKSGEKYSIDNSRIDTLSSLTQSNSDASTVFYGVVSNTGNIDIADVNEEIKNLVEDEKLDYSGVKLDVFANGKQVQSHISGDSGYQDNLLNISLTDDLSNLSTTMYSNPEESDYLSTVTGLELLTKICEKSSPKINIPISGTNNLPYTESDMFDVHQYLNMIKFKDIDLSLDNMNTQELLNHFCNATQLNLFNGNNGNDVVLGARPVISDIETSSLDNKPILVKQKDVFELGSSSLFLKNKIKQVNIDVTKFKVVDDVYLKPNFEDDALNIENLDNKAFFKSQIIENDGYAEKSDPIMEYGDYYIYTETMTNDYYTKLIEDTRLVVAYSHPLYGNGLTESSPSYILNNDGMSYFEVNNYDNINAFLDMISKYTWSDKLLVGFLKSNPFVSRKSYTFIYAIKKDAFNIVWTKTAIQFWVVKKPIASTVGKFPDIALTSKSSFSETIKFGDPDVALKQSEIVNLNSNPLLTESSTISVYGKEIPLYEYIGMNILSDYSRGVKTKTITIACSDLYYTHNPELMAKNWSLGEVLNVGDIINLETEKYRDGSYIDWKITGREFTFDGEPLLKGELQECKKTTKLYDYLNGINWNRVAEISQSGKAEQYFSVGDEKYIESVGATIVILGFNHDKKTGKNNKAGITFGLKFNSRINGANYYMKWAENEYGTPYNTNSGGWAESDARKHLNETFFGFLPESLRNAIVAVDKTTGIGGGSSTTSVTSDKIWIPSEVEMTGSSTNSASGEGTQYPYFNTAWTNGYKTWQRYYGPLRSPNLYNTSSMIKNPNTGASETSNSTNSFLFANGFIGAIEPTTSFNQLICFCI